METWIVVIVIAIILFVLLGYYGNNQTKKNTSRLKDIGIDPDDSIDMGKYVAGHPDIDQSIEKAVIYSQKIALEIFYQESDILMTMPEKKGKIEISTIEDITIEDASTIENKVTVGRMLAVGLFAFALKKKTKNELAYLVIKWNDGKFDHETIFEYDGKEAMGKANTARNELIKIVR